MSGRGSGEAIPRAGAIAGVGKFVAGELVDLAEYSPLRGGCHENN